MPYAIRTATSDDRAEVERIVRLAYEGYIATLGKPPGPMLDDYAARIASGEVRVLVEEDGIAGVLVLIEKPDHLLLDNVAIDPSRQHAGLGRRLMVHAEAEARARGIGEIRLYTQVAMTRNIAIYERFGYEETGRGEQAGYHRVFMRKRLR